MIKKLAVTMMWVFLMLSPSLGSELLDGLVGYWPLNGDAKDYSGNGNHGTIHGPKPASDRDGVDEGAMYFGSGKYISVPNSSSLNSIKSEITMAAWLKVSDWHLTGQRWAALFSKGDYQYCFNLTPDSTSLNGYSEIASKIYADFTGVSFVGHWVHVAVTFGSDKVCRSYVNGSLHKSISCSEGSFPGSSQPLYIGEHPPWDMEYLIGSLDEAVLYNRALSSTEIKALYKGGLKVCMVTFDANGGVGSMNEHVCLVGRKLVLPKNTFSMEGYRFGGWAKTKGGPVVYADGEEVTVTEDMTLYAVWKRVGIIRLHGNGMATAAGEKTYDILYTFGNELKLPENPFVEYDNPIIPAPKDANLLGWSVGTSYFDWTKHRMNSLLSERGKVLIYDNPDDVLRWGGVTEKEGTVVDLYAIWKTRLTVKLHGPQGGELSPAALKSHVFAKLSYENKWHNGEWTMMVPPGTHQLTARVDSEFQDYAKGWQVWQDGQQIEVEDGASSSYTFEIQTDALPGLMDLEMRFQGVGNEYGSVWFEKKWKMTPEQEGGLKNFPAFDPAKVSIRIRRKLSESWGELDITEDSRYGLVVVLLPVGEYEAYFEYADRYWDVYEYDGRKRSFTVDSEDPQRRIVEAVFMPFGVDYYYEFLRDRFERLEKLDVEGKTTAAVPAGVSTIASGAFADAGSLTSIRFGGDAPAVEAGGLDGLSEGAVVRVARGTTGWGEVPGTWQGRTLAYDSLAELDEGASAEKVATALTEVAAVDGARIAAAVGGDAAAYESFREWAQSVKGGETAALDSPLAAASWKLGAAEPLANEPVAVLGLPTDVDVVGGATVVSVAVRDGDEVAEVDSERVAGMIETAASPLDWSEESRLSPSIEAASAGEDGELRFSVVPGEEGMPAAFFRLRME